MAKKEQFDHDLSEDRKNVGKYSKKEKKRVRNVVKDFFVVARKWGITQGKVLDVGTGAGLIAIEFARNLPELEYSGSI